MTSSWISISRATDIYNEYQVKLDDEHKPISRRQMSRRFESLNTASGAKLLRWVNKVGGKREVNLRVLQQMLRDDPKSHERDLAEVHDRIDVLDNRTIAMRRVLRKHGGRIDRVECSMKGMQMAQEGTQETLQGMQKAHRGLLISIEALLEQ